MLCKEVCVTIVYNLHCRIDDIQDNCFLHRGIPAAHTVYGVASTISAAICVNVISLQTVLSSNLPEMIKLYIEMILEIWQGQAMEIYWCDNHTCPLEEKYLKMVKEVRIGSEPWVGFNWTCELVTNLGMGGVYQSAECIWIYSLIFGILNVFNCNGCRCVCIQEIIL